MFRLPISAEGAVFLSSNCFHYRISCARKLLSLPSENCEWYSRDECLKRPENLKGQEPNTRRKNDMWSLSNWWCYDVIDEMWSKENIERIFKLLFLLISTWRAAVVIQINLWCQSVESKRKKEAIKFWFIMTLLSLNEEGSRSTKLG